MRYLLLLLLILPTTLATDFFQVHTSFTYWEKDADLPILLKLENQEVKVQDIYLQVKDLRGDVVFLKKFREFEKFSDDAYQTTVHLPKTIPSGEYYLIIRMEEAQYEVVHEETIPITVTSKRFITTLREMDDDMKNFLAWCKNLFFG